jgi:DNA-binding GntR family transcriptional regulator
MQAISRSPSLSGQVYSYIRDRIISGAYLPGQPLLEVELAQELNVSRTPVSIALTTLVERGLLEQSAGKLSVPKLTLKDVIDLYVCRLAFDAVATHLAATLISKKELSHLSKHLKVWEKSTEEDDLYALWVADLSFHETIYQVSNNRHLIRFAQIAAELAAVYRRNTIRHLSKGDRQRSKEDVRREHQQIYEALAAHDADAAEAAAKTHILNVIDHLSQMEVIDVGFVNE